MRIVCVDDERLLLDELTAMCMELPGVEEAKGFLSPAEALAWLKDHRADLALLDIDMPEMNGLELAAGIKADSPDTAVIFITGYSEYALDAFSVRASGYLLKPVNREALASNIAYVFSDRRRPVPERKVSVTTFGTFEVYAGGRQVKFRMAKCKEMLAYLVDRQGGSVTRPELSSVLWEDRPYDRKQQKHLDVYIRSLRETLAEYGIPQILEMQRGTLRILPEEFDCDVYRFFSGDPDAVNAYRGAYMSAYSWASITEGIMFWKRG